jgi:hypothetical protein
MPVFNTDGNMVTGAHVLHYNTGNVGVCLLGFLDDPTQLTQAAQDSLVTVLAYLSVAGQVTPTGTVNYVNAAPGYTNYTKSGVHGISGHRDWAATDCPGSVFYPLLPGIRTRVAAALPAPVNPPTTTPPPSPTPSASGSPEPTTPAPTPTPTKSPVVRDRGGDAYVDTARKANPTAYPTKPPKPKPTATATPTPTASASPLNFTTSPLAGPSTVSTSAVASAAESSGPGWGMGTTVAGVVAAGAIGTLGAWWSRQRRAAAAAEVARLSTVDATAVDPPAPDVRPAQPPTPDEPSAG